jgi:hypothetical protein
LGHTINISFFSGSRGPEMGNSCSVL